jgi:hypothetical protein
MKRCYFTNHVVCRKLMRYGFARHEAPIGTKVFYQLLLATTPTDFFLLGRINILKNTNSFLNVDGSII